VTGVILAGGRSERMGRDKALLKVGGKRIIDRTINTLSGIFSDMLVVTNAPARYVDLGVRLAGDLWPGTGALGGVYTALSWAPTSKIFVVACDMPLLSRAVIRHQVERSERWDVVVPKLNG
jgi:molybdopterin-guanine dinucleotide biosynthesis protein A